MLVGNCDVSMLTLVPIFINGLMKVRFTFASFFVAYCVKISLILLELINFCWTISLELKNILLIFKEFRLISFVIIDGIICGCVILQLINPWFNPKL